MDNQLMTWVKGKSQEEIAGYLEKIKNRDIVVLGTDEAFVLRDSKGEIKAFKQNVALSAANGGLIQPVPGGPCKIK